MKIVSVFSSTPRALPKFNSISISVSPEGGGSDAIWSLIYAGTTGVEYAAPGRGGARHRQIAPRISFFWAIAGTFQEVARCGRRDSWGRSLRRLIQRRTSLGLLNLSWPDVWLSLRTGYFTNVTRTAIEAWRRTGGTQSRNTISSTRRCYATDFRRASPATPNSSCNRSRTPAG